MEQETSGIVTAVSRQWWLKVNRKPVRAHALDGASFPHVIKIAYTAEGRDYTCRKWIGAGVRPPAVGSAVRIVYPAGRPARGRAAL